MDGYGQLGVKLAGSSTIQWKYVTDFGILEIWYRRTYAQVIYHTGQSAETGDTDWTVTGSNGNSVTLYWAGGSSGPLYLDGAYVKTSHV